MLRFFNADPDQLAGASYHYRSRLVELRAASQVCKAMFVLF